MNKRLILPNKIDTLPWGHKDIIPYQKLKYFKIDKLKLN